MTKYTDRAYFYVYEIENFRAEIRTFKEIGIFAAGEAKKAFKKAGFKPDWDIEIEQDEKRGSMRLIFWSKALKSVA